MICKKEYLGDGVYVKWDGFAIVLTTKNGINATNQIILEPEVVEQFETFLQRVKDFVKNYKQ